jgi:glycosyltransferase involved in cell wall biosynthesis
MKILLIAYRSNSNEAFITVKRRFPEADICLLTKNELKSVTRKRMLGLLRKEKNDMAVVFCEDLKQEQLMLLKLLGFLAKAEKKMVIDKKGQILEVNPLKLLLIEFPLYLLSRGCLLVLISLVNCGLSVFNLAAKFRRNKTIITRECSRKLNIGYLRTDYGAEKSGGAMSHVSGFANGVINLGNDMFFISSRKIVGVEENRVPCHVVGPVSFFNQICVEASQISYNLKFVFHAYKILKKNRADFLYHRSSTFNCSGTILSFLFRKPLILEFNSSSLWKTDENVKLRFKMTRLLMERLNLAWADRITVVSEVLRNQLEQKGVDVKKIVVNPNGADPEIFNPDVRKEDLRGIYRLGNKLLVGFAGLLSQWHGLETLVGCIKDVIPKNTEVHFVIIGDGYLRNRLEKMVEEDGTSNFITFTGLVRKEEMPAYLNACDILVSPHRNMADGQTFFGSPVKIFEYMAMGKPIVASKVGQLQEILKDGENAILVPPDNTEKLANAILRLASDSDLRETLGRKARNDLVGNYTWTDNAKRVIRSLRI